MNNNGIYELLRADGSIVINKALIHSIGLNESILYCELISRYFYFEDRFLLDKNGMFYNSIDDLFLATGVHRKSQSSALSNLKNLGLIDVIVKGIPKKRYFDMKLKDKNTSDLLNKYIIEGKSKILKLKQEYREKMAQSIETLQSVPTDILKSPKGAINNTLVNNTLLNDNGFAPQSSAKLYDFDLRDRYIYEPEKSYEYFRARYKQYTGESHPNIFGKELRKIYDALEQYSFEDHEIMIDRYFDIEFNYDVDYSIWHYLSPKILENRMYETIY